MNNKALLIIILFSNVIFFNQNFLKTVNTQEYSTISAPVAIKWNPTFPILAIGYNNESLALVNTQTNQTDIIKLNSSLHSIEWNNNGSLLAIGTANGIDVWNQNTSEFLFTNKELNSNQKILTIAWTSDSSTIFAGSDPGQLSSLFSWNINENKILACMDSQENIFDLSLSPNQSSIAIASNSSISIINSAFTIQDLSEVKNIYTSPVNGNNYIANSVFWSNNNKSLISILNGGNITTWNSLNGEIEDSFSQIESIFDTDYDAKTNSLAVTYSKEARIYNLTDSKNFVEIGKNFHLNDISTLSYSRTKELLALGSFDHSVSIWNISSNKLISSIGDQHKLVEVYDTNNLSTASLTTVSIYIFFPILAIIIKFIHNKKGKKRSFN